MTVEAVTDEILVRNLGRADYLPTLAAMRALTDGRNADTLDEIWLVEHPPVFTQGQAGKPEHVLVQSDIPVVKTERGGQVTYHGPGQVVAYLLIDIRRRGIKVREFVHAIEASVIETLGGYNIEGLRKEGAPGIYVSGYLNALGQPDLAKIAALGLKVRNGATYHGASLNVHMDLTPFEWINPCGYAGLRTVDLATLGVLAEPQLVARQLARALARQIAALTVVKES